MPRECPREVWWPRRVYSLHCAQEITENMYKYCPPYSCQEEGDWIVCRSTEQQWHSNMAESSSSDSKSRTTSNLEVLLSQL